VVALILRDGAGGVDGAIVEVVGVFAGRQQPSGAEASALKHLFGGEDVVVALAATDALVVLTRGELHDEAEVGLALAAKIGGSKLGGSVKADANGAMSERARVESDGADKSTQSSIVCVRAGAMYA
jgi:hypothetical protein